MLIAGNILGGLCLADPISCCEGALATGSTEDPAIVDTASAEADEDPASGFVDSLKLGPREKIAKFLTFDDDRMMVWPGHVA